MVHCTLVVFAATQVEEHGGGGWCRGALFVGGGRQTERRANRGADVDGEAEGAVAVGRIGDGVGIANGDREGG